MRHYIAALSYSIVEARENDEKRVRIHDEYKYNAQKRGKYCRLSPVQKYNLALAIDRYIKNGLSPSLIKKNIFDEFKSMKGSQMADSTYFDLKLNHKQIIQNGQKGKTSISSMT